MLGTPHPRTTTSKLANLLHFTHEMLICPRNEDRTKCMGHMLICPFGEDRTKCIGPWAARVSVHCAAHVNALSTGPMHGSQCIVHCMGSTMSNAWAAQWAARVSMHCAMSAVPDESSAASAGPAEAGRACSKHYPNQRLR